MTEDQRRRTNSLGELVSTRRSWFKLLGVGFASVAGCLGGPPERSDTGEGPDGPVAFGYGGFPVEAASVSLAGGTAAAAAAGTPGGSQAPYRQSIPGRIEAEDFDAGGEGIAYHDTTGDNLGGDYRAAEGVDTQVTDDRGGGQNVGWIRDGEWLEYTLAVAAGTYDAKVRVASPDGGSALRLALDGTALGRVDVPATGGWQRWTTTTVRDLPVTASGWRVLRLAADGGRFNLNWVEFVRTGDAPTAGTTATPATDAPTATPTASPTATPTASPTATPTTTPGPTTATPTPGASTSEYGVQGYGEYGYGGVSN